ncbi:MAG TPA: autotransporter domain-containing protein, partial [Rhodopila sp.]|nr:autotransporter domain-containing protein [Rhodopila sp.]
IMGSGGLTTSGTGTQTLSGANTYTGATTIGSGTTLALAGSGSIASSAGVNAAGTFDISATTDGASVQTLAGAGGVALGAQTLTLSNAYTTFSGSIGGTGGIAVTGGDQTLTGVNTFSGGTSVTNAALTVNSDAALGNASGSLALNNGILSTTANLTTARAIALTGQGEINTGGNIVTANGVVSGTGELVASGGGTLNLLAANTYSGGTLITKNTTVAVTSDAGLGSDAGALIIQSGTLLAEGAIDSSRTIVVDAGGQIDANGFALDLTGPIVLAGQNDAPLFSGSATVSGSWTLNGTNLDVVQGSTLQGVGVVTAATTVDGTLSPGSSASTSPSMAPLTLASGVGTPTAMAPVTLANSPGTLTFTAPLTLTSGAALDVSIDGTGTGSGAGNYSSVVVAGAGDTFTADGTLQPILRGIGGGATNSFTPSVGQSFMIVQAAGGVEGSFSSLTQPQSGLLAGTRFDALYTSNAVTLYVTPADYTDLAPFGVRLTSNEISTAAALDALRGVAGVRDSAAVTEVLGGVFAQTPQAMPMMLDHLGATVYGDALMADLRSSELYGDTITDHLNNRRGEGVSTRGTAGGGENLEFWSNGFGQLINTGASGNTGYTASDAGAVVGVDKQINPAILIGFAIGYSGSSASSSATGGTVTSNLGFTTAYGSWNLGRYFVDAQAGLTLADYAASRPLGIVPLSAKGTGSGTGFNGGIMAGARYQLASFEVQPELGIRADELGRDALAETGGAGAALNVASDSATSVRTLMGVRVQTGIKLAQGYALIPDAALHWAHELADQTTTTTASFVNAPLTRMDNTSAKSGTDFAVIGLGAQLTMPHQLSAYANVSADLGRSSIGPSFNGGLKWTW